MRKKLRFGFGAFVVLTAVGVGYMVMPRIRLATREQIWATLPASLKEKEAIDRAARVRHARFQEIVAWFETGKPKTVAIRMKAFEDVRALLSEGALQSDNHGPTNHDAIHLLVKTLNEDSQTALKADRTRAVRDAELGLQLGQALVDAGGTMFDEMVAVSLDGQIVKNVLDLDTKGAFDPDDRESILALVPSLDGTMPQLGDAARREFHGFVMPMLLNPQKAVDEMSVSVNDGEPAKGEMVGSYDALATAKLMGKMFDLTIRDTRRPYAKRSAELPKLYAETQAGLPELSVVAEATGMRRAGARLYYRAMMNSQPNSIGRSLATQVMMSSIAGGGPRRAAMRNLLRATLLLRMGRPEKVFDPYGAGPLKVDPKRRLVWSVGDDGKDDGGKIGALDAFMGRDIGNKY